MTASREAESLWQHVYMRVRNMLHPHHFEHEPGGKDEIKIPLGFLTDVTLTNPADTELLGYYVDGTTKYWRNILPEDVLHYLWSHVDVDDDMVPGVCSDGDVLTFDANLGDYGEWTNKPATGGGGIHSVHFAVPLPAVIVPPGPTNITGSDMDVTKIRFATDDSTVAGTLYIGATAVSIGSFGTTQTVAHTWSNGATVTLDLSDAGSDGTYLTVDMAAG